MGSYKFYDTGKYNFLNFFLNWEKKYFVRRNSSSPLPPQKEIEWCRLYCFMGYSEITSWCGFPPYWKPWGDFVDHRFLERGFGINQIYFFFSMNLRNLHNTQEAGKWWAFWYKILIIFFFHSQILKVFPSATGILWIVVSCLV